MTRIRSIAETVLRRNLVSLVNMRSEWRTAHTDHARAQAECRYLVAAAIARRQAAAVGDVPKNLRSLVKLTERAPDGSPLTVEVRSKDARSAAAQREKDAYRRAGQIVNERRTALRAKYSSAELQAHLDAGRAIPNANGDPSFPEADLEDLHSGIHAVGMSGINHDKVRRHLMDQAKRLGPKGVAMIPDNWSADGSLRSASNNASDASSWVCPVCGATITAKGK